jgi:2'-5' RNA ligase
VLDERYDAMWNGARHHLSEGTYQGDRPPRDGDSRWGLSLVAKLTDEVAELLAEPLREVRRRQRGSHYVYPPDQLHVTVRSLEGYQRFIPAEVVDAYVAQIASLLSGLDSFKMAVRGLGATTAGVLARGHPDPTLGELRARLHEAARKSGPFQVPGADAERIRDIAHVSLNVLRPPGVPEPDLVALVEAARDVRYGSVHVAALSLVRYDWHVGSMTMTEVAAFRHGPGGWKESTS